MTRQLPWPKLCSRHMGQIVLGLEALCRLLCDTCTANTKANQQQVQLQSFCWLQLQRFVLHPVWASYQCMLWWAWVARCQCQAGADFVGVGTEPARVVITSGKLTELSLFLPTHQQCQTIGDALFSVLTMGQEPSASPSCFGLVN